MVAVEEELVLRMIVAAASAAQADQAEEMAAAERARVV